MKIRQIRATTTAVLLAAALGLVAGYQLLGTSRDYENYLTFFKSIDGLSLSDTLAYRFEPGFESLSYVLANLGLSGPSVYTIIAGLCILLKVLGIGNIRHYWLGLFFFFLFYLTRYFTLFEVTVLRATVASSLAFFVFIRRESSSIKLADLMLLAGAISMHYSAIVFLPIYLFFPRTRVGIIVTAVGVLLSVSLLKVIVLSSLPNLIFVFSTYKDLVGATFLPKPMIIDISFLCFMIYFWRFNDFQMRVSAYGIMISLALHFSLLDYSLFAGRFRELLSLFFIIYVVRSFHHRINIVRFGSALFVVISGIAHLYTSYIHDPLLA
jgi:hypothetical protein